MNDMTDAIVPKSDQINADDLLGKSMTITVKKVSIRPGQDQPVAISFDGSDKVYRPCKSMARVMVAVWGADANEYVGKSMTLYRDPTVKWGGMEVGGIRISHMTHMDAAMTMALTMTKQSRKPFTVKPLVAKELTPIDVYGKELAAHMNSDDLATWWDDTVDRREELGIPPERLAKMQAAVTAKLNPNGDAE